MNLDEAIELLESVKYILEADKSDLKPYQNKAIQDQMDRLGLTFDSYYKRITPKRDYKEFKQHQREKGREFLADINGKDLPHAEKREKHHKDIRELAKKYGNDDTVAKSILRHRRKMNLDEAIELMESIINEVSVSKWKEAAKNSIPTREQKAQDTSDKFSEVVYPFRPAVYDKDNKKANDWENAEHRLHRAKELANSLPNSNKPANALKKAATNSLAGREQKNNEASKELNKTVKDYNKKIEHTDADRKELVNVQNKWVDTQKREDKAKHLVNKPVRRHKRQKDGSYKLEDDKLAGLGEALEIMKEIIKECAIFEVDIANATEEVPPSTNQIKKIKKDKDTNKKTEVVSVADELFPREGNAKQQENQKILDKINQMIEGTATLEDLLKLVRTNGRRGTVKESLDRAESLLESAFEVISNNEKSPEVYSLLESIGTETLELMDMYNCSEFLYHKIDRAFNKLGSKALGAAKKFVGKVGSASKLGKHKALVAHHAGEYSKHHQTYTQLKNTAGADPAAVLQAKTDMQYHAGQFKKARNLQRQSAADRESLVRPFKNAVNGVKKVGSSIKKGVNAIKNAWNKPNKQNTSPSTSCPSGNCNNNRIT